MWLTGFVDFKGNRSANRSIVYIFTDRHKYKQVDDYMCH